VHLCYCYYEEFKDIKEVIDTLLYVVYFSAEYIL
jgi:hypothetical protein